MSDTVEVKPVNNAEPTDSHEDIAKSTLTTEAADSVELQQCQGEDAKTTETIDVEAAVSDLGEKIVRQVEFYYGDINLARDKFLQEQMKLDDGWVTLEVMLRFNRLKSICSNEAVVAEALRRSTSGLLEVSADGKKIRRRPSKPVPTFDQERQNELKMRSLYIKGFPLTTTLDELMTFFDKFGRTELVFMRRTRDTKGFKGSCFVIFESDEVASKFMSEPDLTFNGSSLLREYRHEYYQRKSNERKEQAAKKKDQQNASDNRTKDMMKEMVTGAILQLTNVPQPCSVQKLQEFFKQFGTVKWIDYEKDATEARIRFGELDGAKSAIAKANEMGGGKIVMNECELGCSVLEGEAELEHWKELIKSKQERHASFERGGDRRRGGNKRKFGGGRRGGRHDRSEKKKSKLSTDADSDGSAGAADGDSD